jgi:succinate dehydrogenase / fumarate reductase cytochrome b subunit
MAKSALLKSSIAKKVAMALSGLLMLFLAQHFYQYDIGFSADTFNSISHFMGNNPLVQFVIQPVLIVELFFTSSWVLF